MVTGSNYSLSKTLKSVASSISINDLLLIIAILSFLGFLDSTYLTILHYKNSIPPCTIGGCESVLTSPFATIGAIPIALIGSLFYLTILCITLLFWQGIKSITIGKLLFLLSTFGLFVALILVGIQAFILHHYCIYCLASEIVDFLLFDCAFWLLRKVRYPNSSSE